MEHQETRYGPYAPVGKPIPLHSYRSFKKTKTQKADATDMALQAIRQVALREAHAHQAGPTALKLWPNS